MIIKNIFAGCSPRLYASTCDDDYIYYCSSSNIIISDHIELKNVIFLDDNLNFIHTKNGQLLSGDTKGTLYLVNNGIVERFKIDHSIQNGLILGAKTLLCVTLNNLYLLDKNEKIVTHRYDCNEILTACSHSEYIYVGTSEGNVLVFDKSLQLLTTVPSHQDRIQGMDITIIDEITYLATCSKDCTIKLWKCSENNLEFTQTLNGHSDWISSVFWGENGVLVSSSFDKSVIHWTHDTTYTWSNSEIHGGSKHFYNAFLFKNVLYGQSSTGGFYRFSEENEDFISGHIDEITSLCWLDLFVLTTSLDKTARIFLSNREIIRAQNHGCSITVGKFLNENDLSIISGAQETIIRVLQPTYISYMSINSNEELNKYLTAENKQYGKENILESFEGLENYKIAAVPAELSLTNDVIEDFGFEGLNEYLLSTTAFNEIRKLYGHYFDIVDIDVSEDHIVSVNKALTKKFSGLFLWNRDFKIIQYLEVHNGTINRVRFSPNGRYICTVSKDKTSALLEISEEMTVKYINTDHNRVVWDCAFSHDSKFYVTCSRDKKIIIYDIPDNKKHHEFIFDHEVTTVDFNPTKYEILAGLDSGEIVKIIYEEKQFKVDVSFRIKSNSKKINILRHNRDSRYVGVGGSDWLLTVFKTENGS